MNIEDNFKKFKDLLLSTKRPGIEDLISWLESSDFKYAPASTRYHNNFEGGLLAHSLNVYYEAMRQKDLIDLFNIPEYSIILASLLHDICKVGFYKTEMRNVKKNGSWVQEPFYMVDDLFPVGHAEKSVSIVKNYIKISDVEEAMIRNHMGFSRDEANQVSGLFNKYPESLIIHNADMIATYVIESEGILEHFKANLEKFKKF